MSIVRTPVRIPFEVHIMNLQIERDSVVVLQGVFVEGDGARRALKVRIGDGNRLLLGRIDDFEFNSLSIRVMSIGVLAVARALSKRIRT